ncbi:MAG: hypothetical protein NUV63_08645, partial [Gallionella sp.]|nr:hypothetical protein [Gallionella sp.]
FVTPALRRAQDKLTYSQAGVQPIELGFAGMGGFLPNSQILDSGLRRITSDLTACGLSRMAGCFINDEI